MRRRLALLLILATLGLGVMLLGGGGVALAATIDGTSGPDDLVGTDQADTIHGGGGMDYVSGLLASDLLYGGAANDTVVGREGNDTIYGNPGSDMLFGNLGKDTITSVGDRRGKDVVNCGAGNDTAYVDKIDRVNKNCETVFLRVR